MDLVQKWKDCVENGDVATLNCVPVAFESLVNAAFIFAGVVALVVIIFSGIRLISSGGDAKQVEEARQGLTYGIIGLLVVFFSFLILNIISKVTGVGCITSFGFSNCQ